jgi:pyruvate/2-oxoglutarate dehydrogenase complex dihydrolipoamide dehydrogenase (E3) component
MEFDAIIIGSGQAGTPLAIDLAGHGWRVAFVEKGNLGGTCINTGCTPTKTMIHRADVAHYARNAARWGVTTRDVSIDLAKIVSQKDAVVDAWREGRRKAVDRLPNLHLYRESARFVGPHEVKVGAESLSSRRIFINSGARPSVPAIPGLDSVPYLTNESMLNVTVLPKKLIVIGGGYIGLEFGQMFARFGSEVTIIQSNKQIVPREDPEVAAELQRALEAEGIQFLLSANTKRVSQNEAGVSVDVESGSEKRSLRVEGSRLLVATGRRPNTENLDLGKTGIQTDKNGYIPVNDKLETVVEGIWALGDVKGGPAFTHISYNDYQIVFANLIEGKNLSIKNRIVPYCVFTDPQLGGVGLTEKEARAKGFALKIGRVPMSRVARAIERDETAGMMKLIVDAKNDRILGATILSTDAGELVQILYALILGDLPYTLMKSAVFIHPTLAEGFFFLMEDVKLINPPTLAVRS